MKSASASRPGPLAAIVCLLVTAFASGVAAQTTSFTYQGKLTDAAAPANGAFDFEFRLYTAASGGSQVGSTVTQNDVLVTNGIFTVPLDFGVGALPGANRFLEIAVRAGASAGGFTHLAPLHQLTASPYAVRSLRATSADSLSATCSECVSDEHIAEVAGDKITGTVPVAALPSNSPAYIRNGTTEQDGANFNISMNGVAGGTLSASDILYTSPQTAFFALSEAAFTARDGVAVAKSTGAGGAYPMSATVYGLVAPVNLPHGATITNVRFVYVDDSTSSLLLTLFAHSMTGGFYSQVASHSTTVDTGVLQNVNVAANWVVDNNGTSLEVMAFPTGGWSDFQMQIRGVVVTYTMPRPAR